MTALERCALLGDEQAQEECTKRGIALPCPCCGRHTEAIMNNQAVYHVNRDCLLNSQLVSLRRWNTRPAPPIGRCRECGAYTSEGPGVGHCNDGTGKTDDGYCDYFYPKGGKNGTAPD